MEMQILTGQETQMFYLEVISGKINQILEIQIYKIILVEWGLDFSINKLQIIKDSQDLNLNHLSKVINKEEKEKKEFQEEDKKKQNKCRLLRFFVIGLKIQIYKRELIHHSLIIQILLQIWEIDQIYNQEEILKEIEEQKSLQILSLIAEKHMTE